MLDPNELSLPQLARHFADTGLIAKLAALAAEEDLGPDAHADNDLTSLLTIPAHALGRGELVAREPLVLAGLAFVPDVLRVLAPDVALTPHTTDGVLVAAGQRIADLAGPMRQVLASERTILNLLGRCSGVAGNTRQFVSAAGSGARILDTRKTTPGLRVAEKYAVRCGGGYCHRMGLHDAVLIKDNHIAGTSPWELAELVERAATRARELPTPVRFVEVEVDTLDQLDALLSLRGGLVDIVLLDNMQPSSVAHAVKLRDGRGSRILLEASGGITLQNVREYARSGVDRISLGALTHHAVWADIALDVHGSATQPG